MTATRSAIFPNEAESVWLAQHWTEQASAKGLHTRRVLTVVGDLVAEAVVRGEGAIEVRLEGNAQLTGVTVSTAISNQPLVYHRMVGEVPTNESDERVPSSGRACEWKLGDDFHWKTQALRLIIQELDRNAARHRKKVSNDHGTVVRGVAKPFE
jgi:hypothetical protein